jgi:NADH-quinone oxidoreductase subunit J
LAIEYPAEAPHLGLKLFGSIAAAAMAAEFAVIIVRAPNLSELRTLRPDFGTVEALARSLFSDYLVAFEVTSVLLLAAIVGAIALARKTAPPLAMVTAPPWRTTRPAASSSDPNHRESA